MNWYWNVIWTLQSLRPAVIQTNPAPYRPEPALAPADKPCLKLTQAGLQAHKLLTYANFHNG